VPAWGAEFARLSAADREGSLEPEDLERRAIAAHLVGREVESTEFWTRAHHEFRRRGDVERAARCAFWLAFLLLLQGEPARSGGWLARGGRLLNDGQHDCVEQGYLLVPVALRQLHAEGDPAAYATGDRVAMRSVSASTTRTC
jgi:hypothetical protein